MKRFAIVASVLVLAISAYLFRDYLIYSSELRSKPALKSELERLKTSKDPGTVAMALVRLSNERTPEGKAEALERIHDSNPAIRAASARALVYYSVKESKIKNALETLLADSDLGVRLAVIESIQNRYEDERMAMLTHHLTRSDLTGEEKLLANFALFQTARSDAERESYLAPAFQMAQDEKSLQQGQALSALVRVARRNKKAEAILRKELDVILKAQASIETPYRPAPRARAWPAIYRYFLTSEQALLKAQFAKFAKHPDPQVQASVLTTVFPLCPANRWEVLKSFKFDRDKPLTPNLVNPWLSAIDRLGGKQAAILLDSKAKDFVKFPIGLANRATQIANRTRTQTIDLCERPQLNMRSPLPMGKPKNMPASGFKLRNSSTPTK